MNGATTTSDQYQDGVCSTPASTRLYSTEHPPSLSSFRELCSQTVDASKYPLSDTIESSIPIYRLPEFSSTTPVQRSALQDEWYSVLLSGPGVYVVKGLYKNQTLIDTVNTVYAQIISIEKAKAGAKKGDHFAASGKNDRIWNSFSKHCLLDPKSFAEYYSNPWLSLICESWLGVSYKITAQVNIVKPGGAPQISHRDYHLGFQSAGNCAKFPKAMQIASQLLTLQGAVAHTGMPLDSGPTRLLPFSQKFEEGYMAYRREEFIEYFNKQWVSLPLEKGDGLFFNPALFHAAGENQTSDFKRSANLLQVSSAFGKSMETIDTIPIIERCWDELKVWFDRETTNASAKVDEDVISYEVDALIKAIGDGYAFPTNLDRRAPRPDGMAPETEQELLRRSLVEGISKVDVLQTL